MYGSERFTTHQGVSFDTCTIVNGMTLENLYQVVKEKTVLFALFVYKWSKCLYTFISKVITMSTKARTINEINISSARASSVCSQGQ